MMIIPMVIIQKLKIKINLVDKVDDKTEKKEQDIWSLLLLLLLWLILSD